LKFYKLAIKDLERDVIYHDYIFDKKIKALITEEILEKCL